LHRAGQRCREPNVDVVGWVAAVVPCAWSDFVLCL
jgi:hypothetical protein